ncbi:MAG: hypothetical protein ABIM89_08515 [Mycobacteriales bacterium]
MTPDRPATPRVKPPARPQAPVHRDRTVAIRTWSVVFQPVDVAELEGFDLVVIAGPDSWLSAAQLAVLQAQSVLVVSHVPMVGSPAELKQLRRVLARWPHRGHRAWESNGALDRVRSAARAGWDGVYLDDVGDVLTLPDGAARVASVITVARAAMPDGVVIMQRVRDGVVDLADAVGLEMPLRNSTGRTDRARSLAPSARPPIAANTALPAPGPEPGRLRRLLRRPR